MSTQLKRRVEQLEPGDHLSLLYEGRDEELAGLVPVIREALSRGHRCHYLTDRERWPRIEEALTAAGISVAEEVKRGRLEIDSSREAFFDDDTLDEGGVEGLYQEALDRAREDGFPVLWWVGEASWFLRRCRPREVRAMEALAQDAARTRPMIVVCQYDREHLEDEAVAEVLTAHPLAILGDEVFPNPFYEPPAVILEEEGLSRADWMIRQLERHRSIQSRLERRERQYETLVENSPDLIARMDRDHRYLYVNPALERFTGQDPNERIGGVHEDVAADPEASRPWLDAIDRAFETGGEQTVEGPFETPDGLRRFETRILPEGPADGEDTTDAETVLVIARDITDRVRAERDRRAFEELYRDFFELSRDGIFITRIDGTIVDLNPAAASILSGAAPVPDEREGLRRLADTTNAREFYVDPSRRDTLLAALDDGPVKDFPIRVRRRDDSLAEIRVSAVPWTDDEGRPVGLKGILRDVTEEMIRHRLLEETTRLYERTLSSLDEAVFVVETGERRIIHCNEAAERIFGYGRSNMTGSNTRILHVDEEHHRRFAEMSRDVVEAGETFRTEFEMRREDGTVFPTFHTVSPLDPKLDLEAGVVSVIRDVTAQKRLEQRLRTIGRQERRRLGHDLHDELGQRLTGLALHANELHRRLAGDDSALADTASELESGINDAIQAVRHVARGLLPGELEERGLAGALEELAAERRRALGVNLDVEADPEVTFAVEETAHLYRIVQEALLNGFRHGGATSATVRIFQEDDRRVLRVRDDGTGFDPSEAPGSGMGLEVMRHRAEAMGGHVEIESRAGWGTTVRCVLPETPTPGGGSLP